MAIRARFKPTPEGEFHPGIPARDLDDDDYAALDNEQRALVRRSPLYAYKAGPETTTRATVRRARTPKPAESVEQPTETEPEPPFDSAEDEPAVAAEEGETT